MKNGWRKIGLIVFIAFAGALSATPSEALGYGDFLGSWCSATAKLTFTHETMEVALFNGTPPQTFKIAEYKFSSSDVVVWWIRGSEKTWAAYSEFSADGHEMYLQQNESAPRREYHRC